MPKIHIRDHDGARVRVWTDEMRPYGQFTIMPIKDAQNLHNAVTKHDLGMYTVVHRCDTNEECKCRTLNKDATIASNL